MRRHLQFEVQLENFEHEVGIAARYIYAEMAIQHAASKSRRLLSRLNATPTFWIACGAAFQSAAYISLARIFDTKSKYNVSVLLDAFAANLQLFQRRALAERKRDGKPTDPPWLGEYLDRAYYPSRKDVANLRKRVEAYRAIYNRAIKPARDKYLAHRVGQDHREVRALFAGGTARDLWRLSTLLILLHNVFWGLLHNGRKPAFRPIRYSAKAIFDSKFHGSAPHESIVREVKELMSFLENAALRRSIRHNAAKSFTSL